MIAKFAIDTPRLLCYKPACTERAGFKDNDVLLVHGRTGRAFFYIYGRTERNTTDMIIGKASGIIVVALMSAAAWGCTVPVQQEHETVPDHLMQIAMQDREAAFEQLAKAMTLYCRAKHATTEARHTCLLERRLEWLHLRQAYAKRPGTP
jgi:hypothetical protein